MKNCLFQKINSVYFTQKREFPLPLTMKNCLFQNINSVWNKKCPFDPIKFNFSNYWKVRADFGSTVWAFALRFVNTIKNIVSWETSIHNSINTITRDLIVLSRFTLCVLHFIICIFELTFLLQKLLLNYLTWINNYYIIINTRLIKTSLTGV